MLKYLLLIALAAVIWWHWKKQARRDAEQHRPEIPTERMVTCASCGVYIPESECVTDGGRHYCCEAHRQAMTGIRSRQR